MTHTPKLNDELGKQIAAVANLAHKDNKAKAKLLDLARVQQRRLKHSIGLRAAYSQGSRKEFKIYLNCQPKQRVTN